MTKKQIFNEQQGIYHHTEYAFSFFLLILQGFIFTYFLY